MTKPIMIHDNRIFLQGNLIDKFEAIQHCIAPRSLRFTPEQRRESIRLVNRLLAEKPPDVHKKLSLFIKVIDLLSILRGLRPFAKLSEKKQTKVLNFFFDSPVPLLRKGFWGLSTLAKLGTYGQNSLYKEIGYQKRPLDWH